MKKIFLSLLVAALALVGCNNADNINPVQSGEEVYTLKVGADNGIKSRADETTKVLPLISGYDTRYILEIYTSGGELYQRIVQTSANGANGNEFNFRLVTNQTYNFLVWVDYTAADGDDDLHYNTNNAEGLQNVTLMGDVLNNDHTRDAFYGKMEAVLGATSQDFGTLTCKRPFGQLNVKTTDWNHVSNYTALEPTSLKMSLSKAYTAFNVMEGDVTGDTGTVEYTDNQGLIGSASATDQNLTCDYIFGKTGGYNVDAYITFYNADGDEITNTGEMLANMPIRPNYKTNVTGKLLTKQGAVNVDVNQAWDDEINFHIQLSQLQDVLGSLNADSPKEVYVNVMGDGGNPQNGSDQLVYHLPSTLGTKVELIHIIFQEGVSSTKRVLGFSSAAVYNGVFIVETRVKTSLNFAIELGGSNLSNADCRIGGEWTQVTPGRVQQVTILENSVIGQINCKGGDTTKTPTWIIRNNGTIGNLRMPDSGDFTMDCYNNGTVTKTDIAATNTLIYK